MNPKKKISAKKRIEFLQNKIVALEKALVVSDPKALTVNQPPVPWLYYDQSLDLFVNQNSIGSFFKINPINIFSLDHSVFSNLSALFGSFFDRFPNDFVIQVIQSNVSSLSLHLNSLKEEIQSLKQQVLIDTDLRLKLKYIEKVDHYNFLYEQYLHPERLNAEDLAVQINHYLVVYKLFPKSFNPKVLDFFQPKFFGNSFKSGTKTFDYKSFVESFKKSKDQIVKRFSGLLKASGVYDPINEMGEADLVRFLRTAFNYKNINNHIHEGENFPILKQIIDLDLYFSETGFFFPADTSSSQFGVLSNQRSSSYVVDLFPKKIKPGCFVELTNLKSDFTMTTSLFKDLKIAKKDSWLFINAMSGGVASERSKAKFYKEAVIQEKIKAGNQSFIASTVLNFIGSAKKLEIVDEQIKNIFSSIDLKAPVFEDTTLGPFSYISGLPFGFDPSEAKKNSKLFIKAMSESVGKTLPLYGNFPVFNCEENDPFSGCFYQTVEGQPVYINPKKLSFEAKHLLITGDTSSGKSFIIANEVQNIIINGGSVFAIDPGYSLKSLIESHGGVFYRVSAEEPFSYNIFHGKLHPLDDEGKPSDYKFNFIINFLMVMVFGLDPGVDVKELSYARQILSQAVIAAFDEVDRTATTFDYTGDGALKSGKRLKNVTLSIVRSKILSEDNPQLAKDIKVTLAPFCQDGQYGNHFDVDFPPPDTDIMGLDHKGIEGDPKVSTLILLLFTSFADRRLHLKRLAGKTELNALILDEAKDQMKGQFMKDYWEKQALQARKYSCRIIVASQSLSHFMDMPGAPNSCGQAILSSCHYMYFLLQDSYLFNYYEMLGSPLQKLPMNTIKKIASMVREENGPSPFFFFSKTNPSERGFFRFVATKRKIVTFSSKAKEISLRDKHFKQACVDGFEGIEAHIESISRAIGEVS